MSATQTSASALERATVLDPDIALAATATLPRPLRARPLGVRAALGMGGSASVILLAVALFAGPRHDASPTPIAGIESAQPATPAPAPEKISAKADMGESKPLPIANARLPFSAFDLNAPEFAQEKKTVAVRDGDDGAGRVDSVTIGQFAAGATFMRVDAHQRVTEKEANADFFLDMTRHATQLGLNVGKIHSPAALSTRFGEFEAADIRLTQPAADGVAASERNCLAARFIDPKASLVIASLACGSASQAISRATFGCLLDRLEYARGSDNATLNEFFGRSEPAKTECSNVAPEDVTASIPKKRPAAHGGSHGAPHASTHLKRRHR